MSIEIMKKAVIGAAGLVALTGAGMAHANTYIDPATGDYSFTGRTELTLNSTTIECDLTLNGAVDYNPDSNGNGVNDEGINITVKSGSVSNGSLCSFVDLGLDASDSSTWWYATEAGASSPNIPESALPSPRYGSTVPVDFHNLDVSVTLLGSCNGNTISVDAFGNGASASDPSFFQFSSASIGSNCVVNSIAPHLEATPSDVDVWQD